MAVVQPLLDNWLNRQEACLRKFDAQAQWGINRERLGRMVSSAHFYYGGMNRRPGGIAPSAPIGNRSTFSVFGIGSKIDKIADRCRGFYAFTLPNANFATPNPKLEIVVVCADFFDEPKDEQAGTLIHELLHLL